MDGMPLELLCVVWSFLRCENRFPSGHGIQLN